MKKEEADQLLKEQEEGLEQKGGEGEESKAEQKKEGKPKDFEHAVKKKKSTVDLDTIPSVVTYVLPDMK